MDFKFEERENVVAEEMKRKRMKKMGILKKRKICMRTFPLT